MRENKKYPINNCIKKPRSLNMSFKKMEFSCIARLILHSNDMLQTQIMSACQIYISRTFNSCGCMAGIYNLCFNLLKDVQIMLNHSTNSLSFSYWEGEQTQKNNKKKKLIPEKYKNGA